MNAGETGEDESVVNPSHRAPRAAGRRGVPRRLLRARDPHRFHCAGRRGERKRLASLVARVRSPDPAACSRSRAGPRTCSHVARGTPLPPAQTPVSKIRNRVRSRLSTIRLRGPPEAAPIRMLKLAGRGWGGTSREPPPSTAGYPLELARTGRGVKPARVSERSEFARAPARPQRARKRVGGAEQAAVSRAAPPAAPCRNDVTLKLALPRSLVPSFPRSLVPSFLRSFGLPGRAGPKTSHPGTEAPGRQKTPEDEKLPTYTRRASRR